VLCMRRLADLLCVRLGLWLNGVQRLTCRRRVAA
jgi:hypothetical protein